MQYELMVVLRLYTNQSANVESPTLQEPGRASCAADTPRDPKKGRRIMGGVRLI